MSNNQVRFSFDSEKGFGVSCEIDGKEHTILEGVTNANGFKDMIEEAYEQAHHVIDKAMEVADRHCIYCGTPIFEFNYAEDDMCIDCYNNSTDILDTIEKILKNNEIYTNAGDDDSKTTVRYTPDEIDLTIEKREELHEQWNKLVSEDVEETIKNIKHKAEAANKAIEESIKLFKEVFKDE